jgi:ribosomal protein L11 methyltransferase
LDEPLTLVRLGIRVRADRAQVALAELLPLLAGGAEEREVDGMVEYALYAPAGELPGRDDICARVGDALVDVLAEPVPDGWEVRWHEFLRPVRVGDVVVRPPWIDGSPDDLVIDPGPFFGAGTHATTRLCLELLLGCNPGGALCDCGAGTGVLAVAAARLGWDPVTAVEVEPAALEVIRGNAAPTVVANLPLPVLLAAARTTARRSQRVIAAGMLAGEADAVVAAFGMPERRRVEEDGWAAVVLG